MTLTIATRKTKGGERRYIVRYRLGGRAYPLVHGGSFKTQREALERRNLIAGEIAAGRSPQIVLQAMLNPPAPVKVETLRELGPRYLKSRIDLDAKTEKAHASALERIYAWDGDRDPHSLTWGDCQEFVAVLIETLKPGTAKKYYNVLKIVLDFAAVEPNPARDGRVKLPTVRAEEPNPPDREAVPDDPGQRARAVGAPVRDAGADWLLPGRDPVPDLGRYRRGRVQVPPPLRQCQSRDSLTGSHDPGTRVDHGFYRGHLPAGGSDSRTQGLPGAP